jgi:hypothetical protein
MGGAAIIPTLAQRICTISVDVCALNDDHKYMTDDLTKLIEAARGIDMSAAAKEAQRRSFAYGNAHIENSRVTREMVAAAAEKVSKSSGK